MELELEVKIKVEELAGLFFTPAQIGIMMDLPSDQVAVDMTIETSAMYRAYWKGFYEAELKYREEVKRLANLGSSPAQTLLGKIIDESKMALIDR